MESIRERPYAKILSAKASSNRMKRGIEVSNCNRSATGTCCRGLSNKCDSAASHAEGNQTQALGQNAHAEGALNIANGFTTPAVGVNTVANDLAVPAP